MRITKRNRQLVLIITVIVIFSGYLLHIHDLNGGSFDFSDTDVKIVVSGSMDGEPRDQFEIRTIPIRSMVFIHKVPYGDPVGDFYSSLEIGDVLTFNYVHPATHEMMVVTHRIIAIDESHGTFTYTLKGDSAADDPTNGSVQVVSSDSGDVIGKVVGVSPALGQLVVFLSTWTGKVCLIIIPCMILIVSECLSIFRAIRTDKEEGTDAEEGAEEDPDDIVEVEFTMMPSRADVPDDGLFRRFQ